MTTTSVLGRAATPGGRPLAGVDVRVELCTPGFDGDKSAVQGIGRVRSAADGSFTLQLTPNSEINPAGTWYIVRIERVTWTVVVPVSGVAVQLLDCLAQPLSAPGGVLVGQPLDADLTAIAALATTAFGRALLTAAAAADLRTAAGLTQAYVLPAQVIPAGNAFFHSGGGGPSAGQLGNGALRICARYVPSCTIVAAGGDVTIAGSAGCTLAIGAWADNNGVPGGRVLRTAIAADAVAVAEAALQDGNLVWPGGIMWCGGVVLGAPATQPTVRTITAAQDPPPGIVTALGTGAPTAGLQANGYSQSGVTGIPAAFNPQFSIGAVPRIHLRVAP